MKNHGFTLIELLVAIGIVLLLLGFGIANYIQFNERQKLSQTKELIRQAVSEAQNSARSGKLRGCNELDYYNLTFEADLIEITAHCDDGSFNSVERALPEGIVFSGSTELRVAPITGTVGEPETSYEISFSKVEASEYDTVVIDHSGTVKEYTDD